MSPLISVIIPVYNAGEKIKNCIDSLLSQTYKNFEIILIDDGSSDTSAEICDRFAKNYDNIFVIHQKNAGPSTARNIGMEWAEGEYFVCVDCDDVVKPCYLQDFVDYKNKYPQVGHIWCGFVCKSNPKIDYVFSQEEEFSVKKREDYFDLSDKILVQSPCTRLYKKEIIKKEKIKMRADLKLAEDIIFNLEYLDKNQNDTIGIINKANYIYNDENEDSLYHRFNSNLLYINELVNECLIAFLKKWNVKNDCLQKYFSYVYNSYLQVLENTMSDKNHASYCEKIKFNNSVLKKQEFKIAYKNSGIKTNPIINFAYKTNNYSLISFWKKIKR